MTLPKDEVLKLTQGFIDLAEAYADEEIRALRLKADKYFGGETPDGLRDRPNRSTYVDTVLRDTVLWLMPSLSRVFSSNVEVAEIKPRNPLHSVQAALSHEWVNQVLTVHNVSFLEDTQAMQDALMKRLGWQRVRWEGSRIRIETVPPENVLLSRDATLDRLSWPFVGIKTCTNPAKLRAEGYEVDDDINGPELEGANELDYELRDMTDDDLEPIHPSLKEVWKYDLWFPDYGEEDWHHVVRVGSEILEHEKVPEHELIYFVPIIAPGRLDGVSVADLSFKLQDVSTAVHRALNDHFYRLSNAREEVVIGGMTPWTLGDLINDQFDGRVRVRAANTIVPIPPPVLPAAIPAMLDHYDERISARTGVQKYQQGLAPDALNKTAAGTAMIMDAASLRIEQIARTFAETGHRERIGLILRTSRRNPEALAENTVTYRGRVFPMSEELLVSEYDIVINPGVGVGNRSERAATLNAALANVVQLAASPIGGRLVPGGDLALWSAHNIYNMQAELLRLVGYTDTSKYLIDPADPAQERDQPLPPPPPTPEQIFAEAEAAKVTIQREEAMYKQLREVAEMRLKVKREQAAVESKALEGRAAIMGAETDKVQATRSAEEADAKLKYEYAELEYHYRELELKSAELMLKYQEAGVLPPPEILQTVAQTSEAVAKLERLIKLPRRVLRDDAGNVTGVEVVDDTPPGEAV
jgi:hypothetical protein